MRVRVRAQGGGGARVQGGGDARQDARRVAFRGVFLGRIVMSKRIETGLQRVTCLRLQGLQPVSIRFNPQRTLRRWQRATRVHGTISLSPFIVDVQRCKFLWEITWEITWEIAWEIT